MKSVAAISYLSDSIPFRVVYPSSKHNWFLGLLVLCKALFCLAIFIIFDLLKVINVFTLVFLIKLITGCVLFQVQRPFATGPQPTRVQWILISRYAACRVAYSVLWHVGLRLCGPFRAILVSQHCEVVIITGLGAIINGVSRPANSRGLFFFLLALLSLTFLDHDDTFIENNSEDPNGHNHKWMWSWLGLADHKLGICLMTVLLVVNVGLNSLTKRISSEIGGTKRLHALSTLMEAAFVLPWTILSISVQDSSKVPFFSITLPLVIVSTMLFIINYYIDSICNQRIEMLLVGRVGSISVFLFALGCSFFWQHSIALIESSEQTNNVLTLQQHLISSGSVLACVLFILATLSLTSTSRSMKGSLIGYSAAGLPLYSFSQNSFQNTSRSFYILVGQILKQILSDINSRKIFYFLLLNLSFTVVEFVYGLWTNSLGLISDAFHMLFDCSALVMGLGASIMAKWKPTKTFPYGYGRSEDLSGYMNGLFLLVIASLVFLEGLSRVWDPPTINTDRLVLVSVAGLAVNLVGVMAFRHTHSHGHNLSRNENSQNHHHQHQHQHHGHNSNMQGVFLHILADTFGSVGVIISSILIDTFGWYAADPICSLLIAILIFASVIPLLKQSAMTLTLRTPEHLKLAIQNALQQVRSIESVLNVAQPHFWQHSGESYVGTLHIQAKKDANSQAIVEEVSSIFRKIGFKHFTVQLEKEDFVYHMIGLGSKYLKNYKFNDELVDSMTFIESIKN